jgi:hypothetical protein
MCPFVVVRILTHLPNYTWAGVPRSRDTAYAQFSSGQSAEEMSGDGARTSACAPDQS